MIISNIGYRCTIIVLGGFQVFNRPCLKTNDYSMIHIAVNIGECI